LRKTYEWREQLHAFYLVVLEAQNLQISVNLDLLKVLTGQKIVRELKL
jgi:hypothetical protein